MRELTFTVTEDELNLIGQALGELQLKFSGNLFQKLQAQAFAQLNPPTPAKARRVRKPKAPAKD